MIICLQVCFDLGAT